jgi:hypothetical protein
MVRVRPLLLIAMFGLVVPLDGSSVQPPGSLYPAATGPGPGPSSPVDAHASTPARVATVREDLPAVGPLRVRIGDVIDTGLDLADPTVLTVPGGYLAAGTNTGTNPRLHVPAATSPDLRRWSALRDLLPVLPRWASDSDVWAPSLVERAGRVELYFAARESRSGRMCIGVAVAARPWSTYRSTAADPLICQRDLGGSIDPEVAVGAGRTWLLWKNDGNCCGVPVRLWSQQIVGTELVGSPVSLVQADTLWERGVVENPTALVTDTSVLVLYSGSDWRTGTYGTGIAECDTELRGCTKRTRAGRALPDPQGATGSGGASAFTDARGAQHLIWHAWVPTSGGRSERRAFIASSAVIAG